MKLIDRLRAWGTIQEGPLVCHRCGAELARDGALVNRLGDRVCPVCGSVDVGRQATRTERLLSFLIDYNSY